MATHRGQSRTTSPLAAGGMQSSPWWHRWDRWTPLARWLIDFPHRLHRVRAIIEPVSVHEVDRERALDTRRAAHAEAIAHGHPPRTSFRRHAQAASPHGASAAAAGGRSVSRAAYCPGSR